MNAYGRRTSVYVLVVASACSFTLPGALSAAEPEPMQPAASAVPGETDAPPVLAYGGQAPSAGEMLFDGLLVRPLMFVATLVGSGLFVATLPASAIGGNVGQAAQRLIAEPAQLTFGRCLGCLPEYSYYGMNRY